jgi:hypothetical protein
MKKFILEDIAYARSGDKGPNANVGVIFKDKSCYDWGVENLTTDSVKKYFGTMVKGSVERYELPNLYALNFILNDSLQGGGSETLINDAQGKTFGQAILMMKINF